MRVSQKGDLNVTKSDVIAADIVSVRVSSQSSAHPHGREADAYVYARISTPLVHADHGAALRSEPRCRAFPAFARKYSRGGFPFSR